MPEPIKRRLSAVAVFDLVGYSRLMERDEEDTHRRLKALFNEVVNPLLAAHSGRLVKGTGDGGLVEFESVIEAGRWALALQKAMVDSNSPVQEDRRLHLRIGITVGDIIIEPDDIYGEGVNAAVRIQSLAGPGGICVTQPVVDQIAGKVEGHFVDLGEPQLKNLSRVIRVFRMTSGAQRTLPKDQPTLASRMQPLSGFGGRPAIVVMPFSTLGPKSRDDYFADGLTEDVTTALASWRSFPVISRHTAFALKARHLDPALISAEVGARYIVEGSIRHSSSAFRISIALVDAESSYQVFAENFDRPIADVAELQEDIATLIVGTLEPELLRVERDRSSASSASFTAYDLMQRGLWHHYRGTKVDSENAEALLRKALNADPEYAQATAALSVCLSQSTLSGWRGERNDSLSEAFELGRRAVMLDSRDPLAHFSLGLASLHSNRIPLAIREMEAVVRINPSYAAAYVNLSNLYNYTGHPMEALAHIKRALALSPNDPRMFMWMPALAGSHYLAGNYEEAIEAGRYGLDLKPDYTHSLRYVAAALGQLGRSDAALSAVSLLRTVDGTLAGTESFLSTYYVDRKSLQHILDGLRLAGFE